MTLQVLPPDADQFPIDDAAVALRQGVDAFAEIAESGPVILQRRLAPACPAIERDTVVGCLTTGICGQHAAVQVLQPRHPQPAVELAREPPGHADVVRMHVGAKDPGQRPLLGGGGKEFAPGSQGLISAHPGVHHGPALVVLKAPDVDVVERDRQGHAHPDHARCDLLHLAGLGRRLERVDERRLLQPLTLRGVGHGAGSGKWVDERW
jgi:hypothetical protein